MEHEVFVPVSAERLREALADPARVAGAVPGLQQDVYSEPVAGRLKVRIGGHTITYRGVLRVVGQDDGAYALEAEATEARGTGTVKLSLSVRLLPARGGTTVEFTGTATGDGRIAELPAEAVASAGARLLGRFAESLGETGTAAEAEGPQGPEGAPEAEGAPGSEGAPEAEGAPGPEGASEAASGRVSDAPSVHDTEVPPSSLDPFADDEFAALDESDDDLVPEGIDGEGEPSHVPASLDGSDPHAEAAHARRTMIGRSAEEVDHAPPRGRYAPVPAPETVTATETLRWAAPAAALILASAIVAGRMLRRRR